MTYDPGVDAAYISLVSIEPGQMVDTQMCDSDVGIILDFDQTGKLLGIEVQGASGRLPKPILDQCERIGQQV
jgi:uncharacterized protein YuzE